MAKKKDVIQTHFSTLKVSPIEGRSGLGVHRTDDLVPQKAYKVLATYIHRYDDGSTVPAFLIEGEGGQIIDRACVCFKVVSTGDEVMSFNDLAREIKRFYDAQDYADDALEELITEALGLSCDQQATIHIRLEGNDDK